MKTVPARQRRGARHGLTLIELVVVLTILVALGGLIVPMLPDFLAKTHFAKCSTTIPELNKLWITSFTGDVTYPDGYDSLIEGAGLFTLLPGNGNAGGQVALGTLSQAEVGALAAIGVTSVYDHTADTGNATLDSIPNDPTADLDAARELADGGSVAVLSADALQSVDSSSASLGIDPAKYPADAQFIVFGIGNNCTAVGPKGLMTEAPTHFGGEDVMNPVDFYQRYCVIFAVSAVDETAEFVCACSIHPDGFDGGEAHIRAYYEDQQT